MTATVIDDVAKVLERADGRWARRQGDEPAVQDYLDVLANAVRTQLGTQLGAPVAGGGAVVVDDVAVKQLRADKERLDDLVTELRRHVDGADRNAARLKAKLDAAPTAEGLDEARTQRDTARGQLADAEADNSRLADQLATTRRDAAEKRARLEETIRILDAQLAELRAAAEKTLEEIAAADAVHTHQYESLGPGQIPLDCECGQPYPRGRRAPVPAGKPDVDPWGDLFGRIRGELAGWSK
jgi:ABC-type transporter Mla subunit MlaD